VERDADRKAFARAWAYLNYNAAAKWAAVAAGVGTAVLYVVLLGLLWLFADLIVHRGTIPYYRDLTFAEQQRFQQFWGGLPEEQQKEYLQDLGLPESAAEQLAEATRKNFADLSPEEQSLVWRAYLARLLHDRVGGVAAVMVLPAYRELPPPDQEAFAQFWGTWNERGSVLTEVGLPDDVVNELGGAGVDLHKLPPGRQELAWRTAQYNLYHAGDQRADMQAADYLRRTLLAEAAENGLPPTGAENNALADRGLLSLVVRADIQHNLIGAGAPWYVTYNPYRLTAPLAAFVARIDPWGWQYGNLYYLIELLVAAILVGLVGSVLLFVLQLMAARASTEASTRLRRAVYHHTFRLGTLAFRALGPGEAVSIFTRHVEAVHDALYTGMTTLFRQPVKFALLLLFALAIHPLLALAFLLFAVLVWLVGSQVASAVRRQGRAANNRAAEQLTLIRESLMLMRLVKVYLMELFNQSRVERQLARYAGSQLRRYRGEAFYRALLAFLGVVVAACLLAVAGLIVLHDQLSVASVVVLATALVSLYAPLHAMLDNRRVMRRGRESAVVLFKFLDRPGEVGQVVGAEFLSPLGRELEFDNVSLREPGSGRMLLQDVSLTIKAGQRVAIVGPDELEKHALVYLIPRFLDPTAGEIRIDEHNLRWVTLDSLRAQIAMVMQHNLVFHDSVANNIGCGDRAFTLPQIIEAAKIAHAHHFIQRLPKGYETAIGELGHTLSVSEQFRIALARAILRDPALIIIEEPETPLEDDDKALVDDTFARVLTGRTAIFLPHRISTIRSCDRIFLLHKGRLEAAGDHRGLLSENPLYRHLHYIEFNEMVEQA
jgi:ATP-binding cassette subfamily B protein